MNILILVGSFLLILSFGTLTFMKQNSSSILQHTYFTQWMTLERKAEIASQENQYKRSPKKKKEKSPEEAGKKKSVKARPIIRDRWDPVDLSKLNLAPLFAATPHPSHDRLYETAASLFRILYKNTAVDQLPDFEYKILDALIEKGKTLKEGETFSFVDFLPQEKKLQEIYYKMMKGTKNFKIAAKEGYPPLENFILHSTDKKVRPICFCFASTPLLRAIFGPLTDEILEEEKAKGGGKKSVSLKKAELEALLLKQHDPKLQMSTLKDLLSFTRKAPPANEITVRDPKSTFQQKIILETRKGNPKSAPIP